MLHWMGEILVFGSGHDILSCCRGSFFCWREPFVRGGRGGGDRVFCLFKVEQVLDSHSIEHGDSW